MLNKLFVQRSVLAESAVAQSSVVPSIRGWKRESESPSIKDDAYDSGWHKRAL